MQHVYSLDDADLQHASVVTIGSFDGVHRGHQLLIKEVVDYAHEHELTPVVLTFFPHPQMVLRGPQPGFYLTMPDTKAKLLADLGVEVVVTHPFNNYVQHIRAVEFVERLIQYLKMKALWVGADFAMGYQREGNVEFLQKQSLERGFSLRVVDLMDAGGERVSSTRIREALATGDIDEATRLLGHPFTLSGMVVEGAKRGRTIGVPTANLAIPEEQAIPARGVYTAWAIVGSERHPSVVNIGYRPTFDGNNTLTVEAHLLDYAGDLYSQKMSLEFLSRLRDELKFSGVDALVAQIQTDIQQARSLFHSQRDED